MRSLRAIASNGAGAVLYERTQPQPPHSVSEESRTANVRPGSFLNHSDCRAASLELELELREGLNGTWQGSYKLKNGKTEDHTLHYSSASSPGL